MRLQLRIALSMAGVLERVFHRLRLSLEICRMPTLRKNEAVRPKAISVQRPVD